MSLSLHTLKPKTGARTKSFRIGRGHGSGRGKTAGRGTKGQKSRTGGRKKLKLKGLKQMLLAFPKQRGFQSPYAKKITIRLGQLERFSEGATVDLKALRGAGLVRRDERRAKVVGGGALTKKLTISGVSVSASAKAAIEKAGGTVK